MLFKNHLAFYMQSSQSAHKKGMIYLRETIISQINIIESNIFAYKSRDADVRTQSCLVHLKETIPTHHA